MLAIADASGRAVSRTTGLQRRVRLAQERGLPERLTGVRAVADDDRLASSREIVIENDIAWRLHTMVDFMFGRPISIASTARDESLRRTINLILDAVFEASGGVSLLADLGLLGHIYGHVDLLVRADLAALDTPPESDEARLDLARPIRIEPVEPTRGIPVLDPADYRRLAAYAIRAPRRTHAHTPPPAPPAPEPRGLSRWLSRPLAAILPGREPDGPIITEFFTADARRVLVQDTPDAALRTVHESPALVAAPMPDEPADSLAPPIVHIQNISQPFRYEGLSEVEPLIPLQNELNTRLSDRASRVTLQSFKMKLCNRLQPAGEPDARTGYHTGAPATAPSFPLEFAGFPASAKNSGVVCVSLPRHRNVCKWRLSLSAKPDSKRLQGSTPPRPARVCSRRRGCNA
jgi:hypothetical protein